MVYIPFAPDDPTAVEWDVVVVGTGMGGSTVGYQLAMRGHRVLFLEKGRYLYGDRNRGSGVEPTLSDDPDERLKRGDWPYRLEGRTELGEVALFAPLGCGTGGSTSERLNPVDFAPRAQHTNVSDCNLPDAWPISYEELEPYYREAEELFEVCGTPDPLQPDPDARLREPPPLSLRDADLFSSFESLGLHPFRAHVGVRFVDGCTECAAGVCPLACRRDAGNTCLLPALEGHGASLLTECEVVRLESDASRVTRVQYRRGNRE